MSCRAKKTSHRTCTGRAARPTVNTHSKRKHAAFTDRKQGSARRSGIGPTGRVDRGDYENDMSARPRSRERRRAPNDIQMKPRHCTPRGVTARSVPIYRRLRELTH
ncbi:hypothetical protein EVAR_48401_1 [Eumeta japonica]|uniref:Uncharacterized protein n=1 Tax=Eumeta variegata TaxID=151549 RepID=A0A4C1XRB5_EUMVA|nr:hypothetical protein EVAR_48401_1 [Eumeta japonica]